MMMGTDRYACVVRAYYSMGMEVFRSALVDADKYATRKYLSRLGMRIVFSYWAIQNNVLKAALIQAEVIKYVPFAKKRVNIFN